MTFLLDTNVVSEWVKPRSNPGVVAWLAETDEGGVFISVATLAELRHGIERLHAGQRRARLDEWLRHDLPQRFEDRVLAVDAAVADAWGRMLANRQAAGKPAGTMDALIAATAEVHDLTLVTRNAADFVGSLRSVINPWTKD